MKKLLFIFSILLLTNSLFSQAHRSQYNLGQRQLDIEQQNNVFGLSEGEFKNLKGSPYINESFLPSKIYSGNELLHDNLFLRYNAYSDEIEIRNSNSNEDLRYGAINKETDKVIKIYNHAYVFVPFEGAIEKGNYFEILSEGNHFDLYKKTIAKFYPPVYAETTYDRNKPAEFKHSNTYYLVSKKGSFFELPNNKNKILKVLAKENKKIKDFAKDNKLDLSKDKDLIRLVAYYNTLL